MSRALNDTSNDDHPLHGVFDGEEIGIEAWPIHVAFDDEGQVMCMVTAYETRRKHKMKFKTLLGSIVNN